ncbi:MAG: WD40 repeat domain-containing serine/threonine-protein kinase [Pirellulales bacterium]
MNERESSPETSSWTRVDELRQAHAVATAFERAWASGPRPHLEDFLPERGVWSEALAALLEVEWELRAAAGETWLPAEYIVRFPEAEGWILARQSSSEPLELSQQDRCFRIGRFRVFEEIGRGGMSVVYRVFDPHRDRPVAMKVLLGGHLAANQDLLRFEREAKLLGQLDHPGIVPAYEIGEWAGNRYFTMPLVNGPNLADHLDRHPISWRQTISIVVQLAEALDYAHRHGVVHRDLTPRNVLLENGQRVRTTDFGLAKLWSNELNTRDLTLTGQVLGTPDYMSPEQAAGRMDVGPATDVHGLGAIFYEMLTGKRPFEADSIWDTLDNVLSTDPIAPYLVRPEIPRDLSAICMKCLEKEPRLRYATAAAIADDLERFTQGRPVQARATSRIERARRWCGRNPRQAILLGTLAVSLVTLAIGGTLAALKFRRDEGRARAAQADAEAAELKRRQELFRVYLSESTMSEAANSGATRAHAASAVRNALAVRPWPELSRQQRREAVNALIPWLTQADLREVQRIELNLPPFRNDLRLLDLEPELGSVAIANDRSGTRIVSLAGLSSSTYATAPDRFDELPATRILSECGRWLAEIGYVIAAESNLRIRVWDRQTAQVVFEKTFDEVGMSPVFHPNGRDLLHLYHHRIQLYRLETGELIAESPPRFRPCKAAFSDDGRYLALASPDHPIEIIDVDKWAPRATIPEAPPAASVAWLPGELSAMFGLVDGRIARITIGDDQRCEYLDSVGRGRIDRLVVSSDGSYVASCDTSRRLEIHSSRTGELIARALGCPIRFGRDDRRLAIVDGADLVVTELVPRAAYQQASVEGDTVQFSPDDRWLAISGPRGVRLLSASDCREVADLGLDACGHVAFRSDGHELVTFGCFSHVRSWPLTQSGRSVSAGPPVAMPLAHFEEGLAPQHAGRHASFSQSGDRLFVTDYRHREVLSYQGDARSAHVVAHSVNPTQVVPHSQGRWIAVSDNVARETQVWDVYTGRSCVRVPAATTAVFSDDGKWLVTRDPSAVSVFEVGSWLKARSIPLPLSGASGVLPLAIQSRGLLIAAADRWDHVRLIDLTSGDEVATLRDRNAGVLTSLCFDSTGSRLASCRSNCLAMWDLSGLRKELEGLGMHLDQLSSNTPQGGSPAPNDCWQVDRGDLPPTDQWHAKWVALANYEASEGRFPDAIDDLNKAMTQVAEGDIAGRADLLVLRGRYHYQNENLALAQTDWESALQMCPEDQHALHVLACFHLLAPEPYLDLKRALALARRLTPMQHDPSGEIICALALAGLGKAQPRDIEFLEAKSASSSAETRLLASGFLVEAAWERGDTERARSFLNRANGLWDELSPAAKHGPELKGWYLRLKGSYSDRQAQ